MSLNLHRKINQLSVANVFIVTHDEVITQAGKGIFRVLLDFASALALFCRYSAAWSKGGLKSAVRQRLLLARRILTQYASWSAFAQCQ
ncbi:hypothetical protein [Almyronema epifaneia]|uniref:Uncharacterized protein n=1 Tax=Almyronema epifaneia S1 TaxID=2991925 RepID=A0ABW6IHL3_9CYAN